MWVRLRQRFFQSSKSYGIWVASSCYSNFLSAGGSLIIRLQDHWVSVITCACCNFHLQLVGCCDKITQVEIDWASDALYQRRNTNGGRTETVIGKKLSEERHWCNKGIHLFDMGLWWYRDRQLVRISRAHIERSLLTPSVADIYHRYKSMETLTNSNRDRE